jgi:hypothetical protein
MEVDWTYTYRPPSSITKAALEWDPHQTILDSSQTFLPNHLVSSSYYSIFNIFALSFCSNIIIFIFQFNL